MLAKSLSVKKQCSLAGNLAFWKVNIQIYNFRMVVLHVFFDFTTFQKKKGASYQPPTPPGVFPV